MASATVSGAEIKTLRDPRFKERLQQLRRTDNFTNLWYLIRTYLFLSLVIGGTIGFYYFQSANQISFLWNVPVTIFAVILIGAGQHQLTTLAHEASHHILFRNRLINDLASDWLLMFPMFSSTQHYRLQHLAHHQFVNDPLRDPDISQLKTSGHWLSFPVGKRDFVKTLLKQLWLPNLFRFMRIRAAYNAIPTDKNPYLKKGWKPNKFPVRIGILYMLTQIALLTGLVLSQNAILLWILPGILWAAAMVIYAVIPSDMYHQSRIHPTIAARFMTLMRITFITGLFWTLAWLSWLDPWTPVYFLLLWVTPIFTSFSFFMILRQIVQHGNGDRGWLTNTRVFFVNRLISFAVFPLGQDYHLPHHLFASIPHYRLPQLHAALMEVEEYRNHVVEVEGYFLPRSHPPQKPTVLDVVGPDYYHKADEIYIDDTVLDAVTVDEKDEILAQGETEKRRRRNEMAKASEQPGCSEAAGLLTQDDNSHLTNL